MEIVVLQSLLLGILITVSVLFLVFRIRTAHNKRLCKKSSKVVMIKDFKPKRRGKR